MKDIRDNLRGNYPVYSAENENVKVLRLERAINLVHIYGSDIYHFTAEVRAKYLFYLLYQVLPRFYLVKPIIKRYPGIPILLNSWDDAWKSKLLIIGVNASVLNIMTVNTRNDLVQVVRELFVPLSPRCLHAPRSLWKAVRHEMSSSIPENFNRAFAGHLRELVNKNPNNSDTIVPEISIVYYSRLNKAPFRHLLGEDALLSLLIDKLNLTSIVNTHISKTFASKSRFHLARVNSSEPQSQFANITFTVLYGNESVASTIQHLSSAAILIGAHGSYLSNMIFLPAGATFIELSPQGYWNPRYLFLASAIGIKTRFLIRTVPSSRTSKLSLSVKDSSMRLISGTMAQFMDPHIVADGSIIRDWEYAQDLVASAIVEKQMQHDETTVTALENDARQEFIDFLILRIRHVANLFDNYALMKESANEIN